VGTRSVASAAETYLLGLFASPTSNMLSMSEYMLEADHQVLHHMLSDSEWDFDGLVSETSRQVNMLIPRNENGSQYAPVCLTAPEPSRDACN